MSLSLTVSDDVCVEQSGIGNEVVFYCLPEEHTQMPSSVGTIPRSAGLHCSYSIELRHSR